MYGGDDGFIDFKAESASVTVDYWDGDFSFQIMTEDFGSMTMAEAKDIRKCLQAATDAASQGLLDKYLIEVEPSEWVKTTMEHFSEDSVDIVEKVAEQDQREMKEALLNLIDVAIPDPPVGASYQGKSVFPSESDDWWDNPQYISAFTEKSYAISPISKSMFPTVDTHKLQPVEDEEQPCRKPRPLSDYPQPGVEIKLDKAKLRMLEFVHDQ